MSDDPGGVRALLALLREQQDRPPPAPMEPMRRRPWAETNVVRDFALERGTKPRAGNESVSASAPSASTQTVRIPTPARTVSDRRHMRFAEALPIITKKAQNPAFLAALRKV